MSLNQTLTAFLNTLNLKKGAPLATALSGGADSLCLTVLLNEWCQKHHHPLIALTVNHGLRPESALEAQAVGVQMKTLNIRHQILTDASFHPLSRIEEQARTLRYHLLLHFCQEQGIQFLFLAHHQEDQAETFLARLARGSGVDGLSGMTAQIERTGVLLCRPFLKTPRAQLKKEVEKRGLSYVSDPMNRDEQYERVRWRHRLPTLAKMDLSPEKLALSAGRLDRVRTALDWSLQQFIYPHVFFSPFGFASFPRALYETLPLEYRLRLVRFMIEQITICPTCLSLDALEKTLLKKARLKTLGGCVLASTKQNIYIAPEIRETLPALSVAANEEKLFLNRRIKTTCPLVITAAPPAPRFPDVPAAIQKSFIHFKQIHPLKRHVYILFMTNREGQSPYLMQHPESSSFMEKGLCVPTCLIFPYPSSLNTPTDDLLSFVQKELEKTPNLDYNRTNTDIVLITERKKD